MNKRWILALVAALILYLGLGLVFGIHDLGATLARLPWFWWLLAPAAALLGHGFLFLRWQFYLGPPEKAATTAGQQRWLIASL